MALPPHLTDGDASKEYGCTNLAEGTHKDTIEASVNTCIAFMFGVVGFLFSVSIFYFYTPVAAIGIIASLFFCLFYSYRAHDRGGNLALGFLVVAADIAFLIGWAILIMSSFGP